MYRFLSIFIICAFVGLNASAQDVGKSVIVVIDNSIAVSALASEVNADGESPFQKLTSLVVLKYIPEKFRRHHVAVISVYRSQLIWEGEGRRARKPRSAPALHSFVLEPPGSGGCAELEVVIQTIKRVRRALQAPLEAVVFVSPLIHTGPPVPDPNQEGQFTCERGISRDFSPPLEFFDDLADLYKSDGVQYTFLGVDERSLVVLDEDLFSADVPYNAYGYTRSLSEVAGR